MNRRLFIVLCIIVVAVACRKDKSEVTATSAAALQSNGSNNSRSAYRTTDDSTVNSLFISKTVANEMISSYIYSLTNLSNTQNPINDLKSFSIDADSLRAYLSDARIKNVKLFFGHTMRYINAGNTGKYSGMQSGALTIIVAGFDADGDYIYHGPAENQVLDHAMPCPYSCDPGEAGNDLLQ